MRKQYAKRKIDLVMLKLMESERLYRFIFRLPVLYFARLKTKLDLILKIWESNLYFIESFMIASVA